MRLLDVATTYFPFLVMGLLLSITGASVGFRTPGQVAAATASLASTPDAARASERARMEKVNRAWPIYVAIWAAFGVAGLALRFAARSDVWRGVGVALVFFAGVGLLVDGFAERRARPYTDALEEKASPGG